MIDKWLKAGILEDGLLRQVAKICEKWLSRRKRGSRCYWRRFAALLKALPSPSTSNCPSLHHCERGSPSHEEPEAGNLQEEGFEAVLSRKPRAMPAVARIFDGEKEAKLIALAWSKPPKGRARWTLRLLENKVVELGIVDRASDSTIGRALKKTLFSPIAASNILSRFKWAGDDLKSNFQVSLVTNRIRLFSRH
jgi:Homeodomain-like domain